MSLLDKLTNGVKRATGNRPGKRERMQELEHAEERIEERAQERRQHEFETWNRAKAPGRSAGRSPFG